ncbi:MAG TPA: HAD-IA family hydrolase [Vicinamibacterales bacterium]|nr:HAD-IA family hydrolase [Vicinamibacterales bacterium]
MAIRLIVFDLDGTLVDSRSDLAGAANELLQECGAAPLDDAAVGRMVGEGAAVLVRRAFDAAGLAEPADALARFLVRYSRRLLKTTRVYDGVPELLARLDGTASMTVLTNKPRDLARRLLDGLGLLDRFGEVFGGDAPYPRKPDPEGLRALMAGAAADQASTLVVGDSAIDLRTARAAGVGICLARYGFGYETLPAGELRGDELFIDAPLDLLDRLHHAR